MNLDFPPFSPLTELLLFLLRTLLLAGLLATLGAGLAIAIPAARKARPTEAWRLPLVLLCAIELAALALWLTLGVTAWWDDGLGLGSAEFGGMLALGLAHAGGLAVWWRCLRRIATPAEPGLDLTS